jgi:hypothetical protein
MQSRDRGRLASVLTGRLRHDGDVSLRRLVKRTALTAALIGAGILVRERQLHWGAAPAEVESELPGDDLLPDARLVATRAVSIDATPTEVWPWIAQLGQGRGGFYSYDALENLVGCEITSADRIEAQWQAVESGDEFRLHPDMPLTVAIADPPGALVVQSEAAAGSENAEVPYDFTWAFVLQPSGPHGSRLIIRERYAWTTPAMRPAMEVLTLISFVMTEKMLRGIRERAEGTARTR